MEIKPADFFKEIRDNAIALQEALEREIPLKIAVAAVEHFKENFQEEGFVDDSLQKWDPAKRKNKLKYSKKGNPLKSQPASVNRKTLTGSGNLGRSIKYKLSNGNIIIYSDLIYAPVHNEGLRAGRGAGFIMPKRQFIGDSKKLFEKIDNIMITEIDKILKS